MPKYLQYISLTRFLSELPMQQNSIRHRLSQLSWYALMTLLNRYPVFKLQPRVILEIMKNKVYSLRHLPLPPVSISTAATFIMHSTTAPGLGLSHASLVFLHFHPRPSGCVVSAPNCHHYCGQYTPIAND